MTHATNRRAVLSAVLAAGAVGVTAVPPVAASGAIAASQPFEDVALFALLTEARSIEVLQKEAYDLEDAALDRIVWPDRPSALSPRPYDHFLVRPRRAEFDEPNIRDLRGLVEDVEKISPDAKINQVMVR
jgi:hypothetical protein